MTHAQTALSPSYMYIHVQQHHSLSNLFHYNAYPLSALLSWEELASLDQTLFSDPECFIPRCWILGEVGQLPPDEDTSRELVVADLCTKTTNSQPHTQNLKSLDYQNSAISTCWCLFNTNPNGTLLLSRATRSFGDWKWSFPLCLAAITTAATCAVPISRLGIYNRESN